MNYIGEITALGAALCWSISAVCWTSAGERVGSLVVSAIRMFIAVPLFMLYGHFVLGAMLPLSAPLNAWIWLLLSGLVGFFLCDLCLFKAFLLMGPRLTLLIFSLSPLATSLIGWLGLNEQLAGWNFLGMIIALTGVIWVVLEAPRPRCNKRIFSFNWKGGLLAFIAMLSQSAAAVMSKVGLNQMDSAVAATEIRLIGGLACYIILMFLLRKWHKFVPALKNVRTMAILTTGTVLGPCIGVALLMFSFQHISTGMTMTFTSLTPVLVIPFTVVIYKEHVSIRAVIGAIIAFTGLALLFLK